MAKYQGFPFSLDNKDKKVSVHSTSFQNCNFLSHNVGINSTVSRELSCCLYSYLSNGMSGAHHWTSSFNKIGLTVIVWGLFLLGTGAEGETRM